MAEGGASPFNSLRKSSDEVIDLPCSSCSRNVESEKFCTECGEYMCTDCLRQHRRFTRRNPHQLVDKVDLKSLGLVEKCATHPGKPISQYCSDHHQLCCGDCIDENHRSCPNVKSVPDVAKGTSACKELTDLSKTLTAFIDKLTTLRQMRQDDNKSLQTQLQEAITKIACDKQMVLKRLDELEEEAVKRLRAKHDELKNDIDEGIRQLQTMMTELNNIHGKLDTSVQTNDNVLFISMKTGKEILETTENRLMDVDPYLQRKNLLFDTDTSLVEFTTSLKSFGEIRDWLNVKMDKVDEYNIQTNEDQESCSIGGLCDLEDGRIIIADWPNECLKMLDSSYTVSQRCAMPSNPSDTCRSDAKELAVTLTLLKQIRFVSVDNTMKLGREIEVNEYCRGITSHMDKLYITCGGGNLQREGPGQVRIYKKSGELLSVVQQGVNDQQMFTIPRRLDINNRGTKIYVVDRTNGIVVLDGHGRHIITFTNKSFDYAAGVCTGNQEDFFVNGWKSHNVVHFNMDGTVSIICDGKSMTCPLGQFLDKSNSKLIVGRENSNCITVLSLEND